MIKSIDTSKSVRYELKKKNCFLELFRLLLYNVQMQRFKISLKNTSFFHFKSNIQNADRGPAIVCFKHIRLFILATKVNRQVFIERERRMHLFIHFIIIVQHSFC